jgi:hypothetical protein
MQTDIQIDPFHCTKYVKRNIEQDPDQHVWWIIAGLGLPVVLAVVCSLTMLL